jgi:polyphosphate kinase
MPRNLDHRVELVTPVEDPALREELTDVLRRSLADNSHAWELDEGGRWTRRSPQDGEVRDVQAELRELHARRAAEHRATVAD